MKFTTGEIISAATGRLCCDIGGVYRILNYLTDGNLFTHQLPRASRAMSPYLFLECPWLNDVKPDECNRENWQEWLANVEQQVGKEHEVRKPDANYAHMDPIDEAISMVGDPAKIVKVVI